MQKILSYPFQKKHCIQSKDDAKIAIHIFVFKNIKKTVYIVNVEQYRHEVFIVKFHTKAMRNAKDKYNRLTNEKDARKIIYTCINIGLSLYTKFPLASFGFIGSPLLEEKKRENELLNTKRFRVYRKFAAFFFSPDNFDHSTNTDLSSYILYNKSHLSINTTLKEDVMSMFENYYDTNDLVGALN